MPGRWAHLYDSPQWKRLRSLHLREHPVCVLCLEHGWDERAVVVDHIQPHRGDTRLFLDPHNLQSLCKNHHDSLKQTAEKRDLMPGCDIDGNPVDPRHPWNRNKVKS